MKKSTIAKETLAFISLFAISGTAAFYSCSLFNRGSSSLSSDSNSGNVAVEATPQEILLSSMTTLRAFDLNASASIRTEDNDLLTFDINGAAVISLDNTEGIKVSADVDFAFNATNLSARLDYFNETVYLNFGENYLYLSSASILSFIEMLPTHGLNVEIPEQLLNLDLAALENDILSMDYVSVPDGSYYFIYEIPGLTSLHVKSDTNFNFTGIRVDNFFYKDMYIAFDSTINPQLESDLNLINPMEGENASKYINFEPALNIFDSLYHSFAKEQNTVNLTIDLNRETTDESGIVQTNDFIDASLDFSYDLVESKYRLNASVSENSRTHNVDLAFLNKTLFIDYNQLKVSITQTSILNLVNYLLSKISNETITNLINQMSQMMSDPALSNLLDNISNLSGVISNVTIDGTNLVISIDSSYLGLDAENMVVTISTSSNSLEAISVSGLSFGGCSGNISLCTKDYENIAIDVSSYVAIDPALTILDTIADLSQQNRFRLELEAVLDDNDETTTNLSLNGGVQFDIENNFGYGDITIVDPTNYIHRLQVDMRSKDQFIFAYNDTLRGKFSTSVLEETVMLIKQVVQNPDEHFIEVFGDLLTAFDDTPLMAALSGDYGILFASPLFSNLSITSTDINITVSMALLGLDGEFDVHIAYDEYHLYSIDISNLSLSGQTLSLSISLKDFDESLESTRLDPYLQYLDFSHICTLLELGINTSKFNYYEFEGTVGLNLLGYDLSLPTYIKIRNDKGDVSIQVDLPSIPVIGIFNGNPDYTSTKSREVSLYFKDGMIYLHRTDIVKKLGFFRLDTYTWTLTNKMTGDYFMNNILDVLCGKVLGLKSTWMDMIAGSSSTSSQIHYEKLLNDFNYNEEKGYFLVDLNISELAQNSDLESLIVKIYENKQTKTLSALGINLNISVGITIKIEAMLSMTDNTSIELNESNRLLDLENFIISHSADIANQDYISAVKN